MWTCYSQVNSKNAYWEELKAHSSVSSGGVPPCHVRPLPLGNLDTGVKQYIMQLQGAGDIINVDVALAAARGIVK